MWTAIQYMEEEKLINMSSRMWGKEKLVWFLMWGLIPHAVRQRDELKVEIHISSTDSNSYHQSYSTWFGATPNFSTNCLCQLVKNIRFNPLFSNLWCWRWNSHIFVFPLGSFLCSASEGPWRGMEENNLFLYPVRILLATCLHLEIAVHFSWQ